MKKNHCIGFEDNGSVFIVVLNAGSEERLVLACFNTLSGAWNHIRMMYEIENQEFFVGKVGSTLRVSIWVEMMKKAGYLD